MRNPLGLRDLDQALENHRMRRRSSAQDRASTQSVLPQLFFLDIGYVGTERDVDNKGCVRLQVERAAARSTTRHAADLLLYRRDRDRGRRRRGIGEESEGL